MSWESDSGSQRMWSRKESQPEVPKIVCVGSGNGERCDDLVFLDVVEGQESCL